MSNQTNEAVTKSVHRVMHAITLLVAATLVATSLNFAIGQKIETQDKLVSSADLISAREVEKQLECLTRNIYWEAASEPFEGKVAVAQVTLNRMASGKFPSTVCGVVHQKTELYDKVVCQFSWLCESTYKTRPVYKPLYAESAEVAKMVMLEGFRLQSVKEALYYHADYVNPRWKKTKVVQIGRHIFYKDNA